MSDPLAAILARWRAETAFPGRVRVYSHLATPAREDERCGGDLPADQLLAAACGAAVAEAAVGGRVLAVIERSYLGRGAVLAALAAASRSDLGNLSLAVAGGDDNDAALIAGSGWRIDRQLSHGAARPVAVMVPERAIVAPMPARHAPAPVHLAGLPSWRRACRLDAGAGAYLCAERWLADLAASQPRLVLPHRDPPWSDLAPDLATIAALAELASAGRRVVWLLPPRVDVTAWLPALRQAAARRIALTLVIANDDLPPLGAWAAAPGWWVVAPAGDGESQACLAQALASERATLVALSSRTQGADTWPADGDHEAGSGRWLERDERARLCIACDSRGIDIALAARRLLVTADIAADVLLCTSLRPLPAAELADAVARGPVLAIEAAPGCGLAEAIAAALPRDARVVAALAESGQPLTPSDVAHVARRAM